MSKYEKMFQTKIELYMNRSLNHYATFISGIDLQVAWLDQNSFPLTYEDRCVIDDPRFSIVRPYTKEWNLHIREARRSDSGHYRCTINTEPVISRLFTLHVKGRCIPISLPAQQSHLL